MNIHVQATLVTTSIVAVVGGLIALGALFPNAFAIVLTCFGGALIIGALYLLVWMFLDDETRGN